jgi:hypothetical protein
MDDNMEQELREWSPRGKLRRRPPEEGNVYTTEVDTGKRAQKFARR